MLKNYIIVALRNIRKYRTFSFINVFGLALAMSVCLLVILMLADQHRYDRFNTKQDRIYRILTNAPNGRQPYATSPFPLGSYLASNYPVIEESVTMLPGVTGDAQYGQRLRQMKGYFTAPSFFHVFDFDLEKGNEVTALLDARSVVISSELASFLFHDEDPIGKVIQFADRKLPFPVEHDANGSAPVDWGNFTVTGIINASKYKSHLRFDVLMSASTLPQLHAEKKVDDLGNDWDWFFRPYTYVLLRDDKTIIDLDLALADVVKRNEANIQAEHSKGLTLSRQALSDVQMNLVGNDTNNRMPIQGYYFLAILAAIIMISACLNYTNLSIARALTRAKEIGIRKVTGANKRALVSQFLGESIIISMLALVMSIVMLQALRPAFKSLWLNQFLEFELPSEPTVYVVFAGFALLIGMIAGIYPAFRMSAYQPIMALKKQDSGNSRWGLRRVLNVSQFCVSLLFITTSILIFNQFRHYMSFDYGMTTENVININLQGHDHRKVANELSQVAGVVSTSATDLIPATGRSNGTNIRKPGEADYKQSWVICADENFIGNLGLTLIAGENLHPSNDSTSTQVIVNEDLVRSMGYQQPSQAIGEVLENKWEKQPLRIVGVVKDFRYKLLINSHEIGPLMIYNRPANFSYLNVRVSTNDLQSLVAALDNKWKAIDPLHPIKYEFYDDELASTHQAIFDVVSILGFISFLAIVIACLGLLGMAMYMTERKKKEVGIRKVLGAADWGIVVLLSTAFIKVLTIAVLIGAPLSYFINNLWLEMLPNRVAFGFGTVSLATLLLLMLGLITIGSQTIRASRTKPVETLKDE